MLKPNIIQHYSPFCQCWVTINHLLTGNSCICRLHHICKGLLHIPSIYTTVYLCCYYKTFTYLLFSVVSVNQRKKENVLHACHVMVFHPHSSNGVTFFHKWKCMPLCHFRFFCTFSHFLDCTCSLHLPTM